MEEDKTQIENSVEEIFCKPFDKLKSHEMSEEDTELLIMLLMKEKINPTNTPIAEKDKPFLYQVIEKRIDACFTFEITDARLILFLCAIAKSPGTAIMYLAYLQYWCKKNDVKEIDLEKFAEIFPNGFPCEEDLQKIWDEQKVSRRTPEGVRIPGSDNLLDYQTAYKSIQFQ